MRDFAARPLGHTHLSMGPGRERKDTHEFATAPQGSRMKVCDPMLGLISERLRFPNPA